MTSDLLPELLVTTRGWQHPGWDKTFYPDDMPAEWRLSYFANNFAAVLVSRGDCEKLDTDTVERWLDELEDDFDFYLEADVSNEIKAAFANRLGGILIDNADNARTFEENKGISLPNSPGSRIFVSLDGEQCFSLYQPPGELTLADLRADIEGLLQVSTTARRCVLCWDTAEPKPGELENARVIAELLGA